MQINTIKPYCEAEKFEVEYEGHKYSAERIYGHESRNFKFNLGKKTLWAYRCDGADFAFRVGVSHSDSLDPNAVAWSSEKVWIPNDLSLVKPRYQYLKGSFINIYSKQSELTAKGFSALVGLGLSEIRDFNEQHPGLPIKTNLYEGLYEDGKTPALVNRSFVEWKEGSNHNSIIFDVVRPFNVDLPTHLQITENINAQEKTYQRNDLLVSGQDSFISSHKVRNLSDLILIENGFLKLTSTYMEAVMSEDKKETQSHEKQAEERIYIRPSLKNDDREILKQIPGHQYNPKIRIWSVPKAALKNSDPRILDMQMYANFNDIFSKKEISKEAKAVLLQIDKKVEHKLKR